MKRYLLSIFLFSSVSLLFGQNSQRNLGEGILLNLAYGYQQPGGDLSERFGYNFNLGGGLEYITSKSNLIFGAEGYFMFGDQVKFDVLDNLRNDEGNIIGNDRFPANLQLRQRGFYIGALVGKLFPISKKNKRSGIRLTGSIGVLQHQIRIQRDPNRSVPQLLGDYEKGYDRLTNGLALNQFIGYQLLSSNKRINFYIGLEFTQAFTQSRRDFDFDTRMEDNEQRFDMLIGIKGGWVLPFYFGRGSEEIFY
ncbi:MAG: hypothetical protein AAF798_01035 [Bacteroidota bacterium]